MGDHPLFAHAMKVETRMVDGYPVVFQYGEVRPDFEDCDGDKGQKRTALNGAWEFRFDPEKEGEKEKWFAGKGDGWRMVDVPHCWDAMPGGRFGDKDDQSVNNPPYYNGAAWYRRTVKCSRTPGRRYRIELFGVRERSVVYFNGEEVARHEGVGAPFSVDVTKQVKNGENLLAVKVIRLPNYKVDKKGNFHELEYIHTPHPKPPDYWPYAGITGGAALVEEGMLTIRKVQVSSEDREVHAVAIIANNRSEEARIAVRMSGDVFDGGDSVRRVRVPGHSVRAVQFWKDVVESAKKWEPGNPVLHKLEIQVHEGDVVLDSHNMTFGLSEMRVAGDMLQHNDKPIFLKGSAVYSETEDKGAALDREDYEEIFELALDADCNFLRLQVNQREPIVYELADKYGILVTGEWGGFWYKKKSMKKQTDDPYSIYQSMGRCAVWDLMNHPSIGLWCIHNESHQFCSEYELFVKAGGNLVRELDGGRVPITWAAWHPCRGQPHFEHADVIGFNEYHGAMTNPFEDLDPDLRKVYNRNPGKPFVILENGAWGTQGNKHSEEWQEWQFGRQWSVLKNHCPPMAGYTCWCLKDYRSRMVYTATKEADGWSRMGMYSEYGEPKMVRDAFKKLKVDCCRKEQ